MAVLTQLVYPWGYPLVVNAAPIGIGVLELRNLLEVVLLAWTIGALLRTRADEPPGMRPQPRRLPDRALS